MYQTMDPAMYPILSRDTELTATSSSISSLPSAPPAFAPPNGREIEERIDVRSYLDSKIHENSKSIRNVFTHSEWERGLWMANMFVIPLIVYPILSLFGHLIIEILIDDEVVNLKEAKKWLDDKYMMRPNSHEITVKKFAYNYLTNSQYKINTMFFNNGTNEVNLSRKQIIAINDKGVREDLLQAWNVSRPKEDQITLDLEDIRWVRSLLSRDAVLCSQMNRHFNSINATQQPNMNNRFVFVY